MNYRVRLFFDKELISFFSSISDYPSHHGRESAFGLYNQVARESKYDRTDTARTLNMLFHLGLEADMYYRRIGVGLYVAKGLFGPRANNSGISAGFEGGPHDFLYYDGNQWYREHYASLSTNRDTYTHSMDLYDTWKTAVRFNYLFYYKQNRPGNIRPTRRPTYTALHLGFGEINMHGKYIIKSDYLTSGFRLAREINIGLNGSAPLIIAGISMQSFIPGMNSFGLSINYHYANIRTIRTKMADGRTGVLRDLNGKKVSADYSGIYLTLGFCYEWWK